MDCKVFEGIPVSYYFTEEELRTMKVLDAVVLGESLKGQSRALFIGKLLDKPLHLLEYKVKSMLDQLDTSESQAVLDKMKLFVYDGYDTTLVNLLRWLNATNVNYPESTVFSSHISIELLYSSECMESESRGEDCFSVLMRYNGNPLEFEG